MSLISSHKESSWVDLAGKGLDFESLVMLFSSSSFFLSPRLPPLATSPNCRKITQIE